MLLTRLILALWITTASSLFAFSQCNVPPDLKTELTEKYPEWSIVTPENLNSDDRETWKSLHPKACPGLLKGRFTGDSDSFALALIQRRGKRIREQVILLEARESGWTTVVIEPPNELTVISVIVKLPPGYYTSFDGTKRIKTSTDSIDVAQLEAHAAIRYWDGARFKYLIWSD